MADKPEEPQRGDLESTNEKRSFRPSPLEVDTTLSIAVDLPPTPPQEIPEDEAAVAIDDVPVDPGFVESPTDPTTTSVAIVASRLTTAPTPTQQEAGGDEVPLPASDAH